jgi:hypothetical protein
MRRISFKKIILPVFTRSESGATLAEYVLALVILLSAIAFFDLYLQKAAEKTAEKAVSTEKSMIACRDGFQGTDKCK